MQAEFKTTDTHKQVATFRHLLFRMRTVKLSFRVSRKSQNKGGSFILAAFDFNRSAMIRNDVMSNCKTEAGTAAFGGKKWFEDVIKMFLRNSDTCIMNCHPDTRGLALDNNTQFANYVTATNGLVVITSDGSPPATVFCNGQTNCSAEIEH